MSAVTELHTELTDSRRRERCNAAVKRIKEFLLDAPQKIDTERLKFLLEAYEEFSSEPIILLRAHLFEKVLTNKTLFIDDNPIVGTVTGHPAGVYIYPEWDSDWIIKEMNQAMMSHLGKVDISDEDKALMRQAGKFFKKRSATYKAHQLSKQLNNYDPANDIKAGLFTEGTLFTVGAGNVDYGTFVSRGLEAIITETEERLNIAKEACWLYDKFGKGNYCDVPGLCKVADIGEIESKGWSLTPGAYVGVAPVEDDGVDFHQRMAEIHRELLDLQAESNELMATISRNMKEMGI